MTTENLPDLEAEVARRMDIINRREALRALHARLTAARTDLKHITRLPDLETPVNERLVHLIVNDIEPLMWRVEQRIIELQKEDA